MEFYTSYCEKRPVRLSEKTRLFAYDSLYNHRYGIDTRSNPCININSDNEFSQFSLIKKYDKAIREIAIRSPIRICNGETLSCSATYGDAIDHWVPFTIDKPAHFSWYITLNC